jgi:hypothetical protein
LLGRVGKNSTQLFFPRLPSAPAKKAEVKTSAFYIIYFIVRSAKPFDMPAVHHRFLNGLFRSIEIRIW